MRADTSLRTKGWRIISVGLIAASVGCAGVVPADYRTLEVMEPMTPIVRDRAIALSLASQKAAEEAGVDDAGDPLANYVWYCNGYGEYVDELRDPK